MPASEFEQPARRVGGGGGLGRLGLVVWVLGLAGIVGVAVAGRFGDEERAPDAATRATAAPSDGGPGEIDQILVLSEPAPAQVTTVAIRVRGRAADVIAQVEVVLLRADRPVASQMLRPTQRGLFGGVFTLGAPRQAGPMTLVAIGRDRNGVPVATVQRPVNLGALRAAVPDLSGRRGEDGIFGAVGIDPPGAEARTSQWSYPIGRLGGNASPVER